MQNHDELKADLTAVGAIFILIIMLSVNFISEHRLAKELYQTKVDLLTAKVIVVELDKKNDGLHEALAGLNNAYTDLESEANYWKKLSNIKDLLRQYSLEDQATGLSLAWTESDWNYNAKHKSSARGICGVIPLWDPYLKERGIKPNSVDACIAIYNFYLEQTGSKSNAIKEYKGIESKRHLHLVKKTLEVKQIILKELKSK